MAYLRVDTLVLTNVLARAALVRISTRPPVSVQFVSRRTPALVGAKCVETFMLARFRILDMFWFIRNIMEIILTYPFTFIDILAGRPRHIWCISPVTATPERSQGVDTDSIPAQVGHGLTLVNVPPQRTQTLFTTQVPVLG